MIHLIPYHRSFAPVAGIFFNDSLYSHFSRGINRYLTLDECENLPNVLEMEPFMLMIGQQVIGMAVVKEERQGVCKFALVLDQNEQKKGFAKESLALITQYCFERKAARVIVTDVLTRDDRIHKGLLADGFVCLGEIPDYDTLNGKSEPVKMFYKRPS